MKKYIEPSVKVTTVALEDIILTSGGDNGFGGEWDIFPSDNVDVNQ